jgi:hypothetical protein
MGLFKINCHEGKMLCDKNQYKETSLWEKIKLNMYLVLCSECRSYTSNNTKLTKAMKSPKVQSVTAAEKNTLKERLAQEMGQ